MKRNVPVCRTLVIVGLMTAVSAVAVDAQDDLFDRRGTGDVQAEVQEPAAYGPSTTLLQIPASAFVARRSTDDFKYATPGYLYSEGSTSTQIFWAPIQLPTGAKITGLGLYYYDTDPGDNIRALVLGFDGTGSGGVAPPNPLLIEDVVSTSNLGYGYVSEILSTPHTVENDIDGATGFAYSVVMEIPDPTSALRFKSVEIAWERQISPAPGFATFGDVPLGSFGFQHVEALAASGITAGCGGGNFCPNSTLTRVEMAIFLAKGLGLHWPN
jgi:hypothetical protein